MDKPIRARLADLDRLHQMPIHWNGDLFDSDGDEVVLVKARYLSPEDNASVAAAILHAPDDIRALLKQHDADQRELLGYRHNAEKPSDGIERLQKLLQGKMILGAQQKRIAELGMALQSFGYKRQGRAGETLIFNSCGAFTRSTHPVPVHGDVEHKEGCELRKALGGE